jgi:quinol---cytochrome c reductase iron-sulfur subunit, bacillus type
MAHAGDGEDGRRKTLKKLVTGGTAVVAAGTALPPVRLLLAPVFDASGGKEKWTRVARLDDLADGKPKRVAVVSELKDAWTRYEHENLGAIWLLRDKDEVRALSVTCPHLGCGIEFTGGGFGCPCHTSSFDRDGKRKSGPSPRDMDAIDTRVIGDGAERVIEVKFKKYRQGVTDREEIK